MKTILILLTMIFRHASADDSQHGRYISLYSFEQTVDRLKTVLKEKNIKVFCIIDHAGEATQAGLDLRPTRLFIIGNPKVGTALMQEDQETGIDLPLKVLVYSDKDGHTIVLYKKLLPIADARQLKNTHKVAATIDSSMNVLIKHVSQERP
ncbi:hypothetical protein DF182_08905 [Chitinophaga flava]|uniref:DUF302 domain-containing protein n=2 Tax=Chitinophaga flava TaxID=2259036 RepID=A0A365Y260_9BACT|nr:hypothetical protein DF182_08905 [Chitinophaga flava]